MVPALEGLRGNRRRQTLSEMTAASQLWKDLGTRGAGRGPSGGAGPADGAREPSQDSLSPQHLSLIAVMLLLIVGGSQPPA